MFELKPIHKKSIPSVLEKAERYRLLNEPLEAESICLDVLQIDPGNKQALVMLILALTDQFERRPAEKARQARELLPRLEDEYAIAYYGGIICERRAKTALKKGGPGSGTMAHGLFRDAMGLYEQAIELATDGNDEAILRWNTCARLLNRNSSLVPDVEPALDHLE